jgi:hypothetical protein
MTSPASLLQQWLRPTTAFRLGTDTAPRHLAAVAGGLRAEPDDHAWATSNVRRHLFRASMRVAVLVALDLLALVTLDAVRDRAREIPPLALGLGDLLRDQSPAAVLGGWGQFAAAMILSMGGSAP